MSDGYSGQSIEKLQEELEKLRVTNEADKIAPIMLSKSMFFLASEIGVFKQALCETVNKANDSSNNMLITSKLYFIGSLILSSVVAFSALVQAGIIKLP